MNISLSLLQSVCKTGKLVLSHEAPLTAGFGAELAATVQVYTTVDTYIQCVLYTTCSLYMLARTCAGLSNTDTIVRIKSVTNMVATCPCFRCTQMWHLRQTEVLYLYIY